MSVILATGNYRGLTACKNEKKRRLQRHLEEHLCMMHRACEKRCRDRYQGPIDLLYASINFNVMTLRPITPQLR